MWLKHAEFYHLAKNVSDVQRYLLCRPYDAMGRECSLGNICSSSNIDPKQRFWCDTRHNAMELDQNNHMVLETHSKYVSCHFVILFGIHCILQDLRI